MSQVGERKHVTDIQNKKVTSIQKETDRIKKARALTVELLRVLHKDGLGDDREDNTKMGANVPSEMKPPEKKARFSTCPSRNVFQVLEKGEFSVVTAWVEEDVRPPMVKVVVECSLEATRETYDTLEAFPVMAGLNVMSSLRRTLFVLAETADTPTEATDETETVDTPMEATDETETVDTPTEAVKATAP